MRRRRLMVTCTVLVNGSAFSSHAWASRSSALRAAGAALRKRLEHGELLWGRFDLLPVACHGAA